jgi:hypothetical protein
MTYRTLKRRKIHLIRVMTNNETTKDRLLVFDYPNQTTFS